MHDMEPLKDVPAQVYRSKLLQPTHGSNTCKGLSSKGWGHTLQDSLHNKRYSPLWLPVHADCLSCRLPVHAECQAERKHTRQLKTGRLLSDHTMKRPVVNPCWCPLRVLQLFQIGHCDESRQSNSAWFSSPRLPTYPPKKCVKKV